MTIQACGCRWLSEYNMFEVLDLKGPSEGTEGGDLDGYAAVVGDEND